MSAVLKARPLSPAMQELLGFMSAEPDRSVHRHQGGIWSRYAFTYQYCWSKATVEALVTRGFAHWSAERPGRPTADGQPTTFPVRCTLNP